MNKFSDVERYEVELMDKNGKKKTFKARPRCFDLLDELDKMRERYKDVKKEKDKMMSDYEALAILFDVHKDVMTEYSHDLIIQITNDYSEYRRKKLVPQEPKETIN